MRTIEISDETFDALTRVHGDVSAYLEKLLAEAVEVAAVQEGIDVYNRGDFRPLEEFGKELQME